MDFGKAFSYQFEDTEWVRKILIVGLICLIPIFGQIYGFGWMLSVMKRVQEDHPAPLPDDFDFGGNFVRGLKAMVVAFVYTLPIFILYLPTMIVPLIAGNGSGDTAEVMGIVAIVVSVCCGGLAVIVGILVQLLLPAAYGRFNINELMGDALKFKEVFELVKSSIGTYFLVFLGTILAGIIGSLGSVICFVGIIFTMPYAYSIMAHLYAQGYKKAIAVKQL